MIILMFFTKGWSILKCTLGQPLKAAPTQIKFGSPRRYTLILICEGASCWKGQVEKKGNLPPKVSRSISIIYLALQYRPLERVQSFSTRQMLYHYVKLPKNYSMIKSDCKISYQSLISFNAPGLMAKGSEKLGCSWWSSGLAGQSSKVWAVQVPGWTSSSGREGDGSDTWQMSGDRSPRTNESAGSQSGQTEEPAVENKNQNMANRFGFSMVADLLSPKFSMGIQK